MCNWFLTVNHSGNKKIIIANKGSALCLLAVSCKSSTIFNPLNIANKIPGITTVVFTINISNLIPSADFMGVNKKGFAHIRNSVA